MSGGGRLKRERIVPLKKLNYLRGILAFKYFWRNTSALEQHNQTPIRASVRSGIYCMYCKMITFEETSNEVVGLVDS